MSSRVLGDSREHCPSGFARTGVWALALVAASAPLLGGGALLAPGAAQASEAHTADAPPPPRGGPNITQGPGLIPDPSPDKTTPPDPGEAEPQDAVGAGLEACADSDTEAAGACAAVGGGYTALQGAINNS